MLRTQISIGTQDELFDATKKNDMDLVTELLSRSCSPNHTDQVCTMNIKKKILTKTLKNHWTPLHFTCAYNNFSAAEILIEHKADVSAVDKVVQFKSNSISSSLINFF